MDRKEIVWRLRELAKETEGETEILPTILKDIASGYGSQAGWSRIEIDKIFAYLADMIEE